MGRRCKSVGSSTVWPVSGLVVAPKVGGRWPVRPLGTRAHTPPRTLWAARWRSGQNPGWQRPAAPARPRRWPPAWACAMARASRWTDWSASCWGAASWWAHRSGWAPRPTGWPSPPRVLPARAAPGQGQKGTQSEDKDSGQRNRHAQIAVSGMVRQGRYLLRCGDVLRSSECAQYRAAVRTRQWSGTTATAPYVGLSIPLVARGGEGSPLQTASPSTVTAAGHRRSVVGAAGPWASSLTAPWRPAILVIWWNSQLSCSPPLVLLLAPQAGPSTLPTNGRSR